jgi:hypothetical protein
VRCGAVRCGAVPCGAVRCGAVKRKDSWVACLTLSESLRLNTPALDDKPVLVHPPYEGEQVVPQHLKDHAHVAPMWTKVVKGVQHAHAACCVFGVTLPDLERGGTMHAVGW